MKNLSCDDLYSTKKKKVLNDKYPFVSFPFKELWIASKSLFERTRFKLECNCLKWQKLNLNLIQILIGIFFEKGTRGAISYIFNRYSKVNNKYLKSYDPIQETGAKNLYDYATSKFFPTSGFKWIDTKEFDINKYTSNSSKGCVLEVDLEYPKELLELHNDYPLTPDKIEIKREMLFEYHLKIADLYNISIGNVKKLVPNSFNKEKYVLHYEILQLDLRLGLKLKKIHRVFEFNQSQSLKPYIKFNTQKRTEAEEKETKMEKRCTN